MAGESLSDYEHDAVDSVERLREVYGEPNRLVIDKVADRLDATTARFVAASSLVIVGSQGADGRLDVSPRGGPPGFVRVLGERLLAMPDAKGNRRLDTLRNVAETGRVGMLFLVPGRPDTIRVNGRALISMRPELLERMPTEGGRPNAVLLVEPREVFMHCPRALNFSGAWKPEEWLAPGAAPSGGEMLAARMAELGRDLTAAHAEP
ncbi:MSMEG_1061 family FMN-dependent PPOX-type flavoprotein [Thermomonospora cellulosilytica]|uniref:PPOX class probable FMN-dependent enzyme n=1 Tax=Thermomonospora cellulosilytica TaxID=1411118 RepID=A0A7W3R8S3_9ACTN|nr:MSMEG_1061 family FMN-dependent PPOX-type flavoprotein [Thermomonospora cellulosilytica]MBA9004036.1 PPOX class probable FMN-dependent enzyme [Thermomonospora cellulosilytica]